MAAQPVYELAIARLKEGVAGDTYLAASEAIQPDLRAMPGFIDRRLLKSDDGLWVELLTWASLADAQRAAEVFPTLPCFQPIMAMLDDTTIAIHHLHPVREWLREPA